LLFLDERHFTSSFLAVVGQDTENNLIALCFRCHAILHER
jgi:predicted HNH restriction endonuclease